MPRTAFDPSKQGFRFSNNFVNTIATLPGYGSVTTLGRCGGMAYASLDYFFHKLQIPTTNTLPPDGNILADYIYKRLLDTFIAPTAINFVSWTLHADHPTWFFKGVTRWTREDEFPRLCQELDKGLPQPLGLIGVTDLAQIGSNHQVTATGYEDDGQGNLTVYVYDNNYANVEARLWTVPGNPHWTLSCPGRADVDWRGFFVQAYSAEWPDFLLEGRLLKESSRPEVYVTYGGGRFWIPNPEEFSALGYDWGSVRTISDGSIAYVAQVAADGTLLRERSRPEVYVMEGGRKRWVTSPAAFEAMGYSWNNIRIVPDGSLASCPDGPAIEAPTPPTPPPPQPVWSATNSGSFNTSDGDTIDFAIERGVTDPQVVEFVLALGPGVTWKKVLNLPDGEGNSWDIAAEGAGASARESLWAGQVQNGQVLTFKKAKFLGFLNDVHTLGELGGLTPGSRVTFTWVKD